MGNSSKNKNETKPKTAGVTADGQNIGRDAFAAAGGIVSDGMELPSSTNPPAEDPTLTRVKKLEELRTTIVSLQAGDCGSCGTKTFLHGSWGKVDAVLKELEAIQPFPEGSLDG